jgi:hypothetical protein
MKRFYIFLFLILISNNVFAEMFIIYCQGTTLEKVAVDDDAKITRNEQVLNEDFMFTIASDEIILDSKVYPMNLEYTDDKSFVADNVAPLDAGGLWGVWIHINRINGKGYITRMFGFTYSRYHFANCSKEKPKALF